jgi:putative tricarboxylic transport membrane protein
MAQSRNNGDLVSGAVLTGLGVFIVLEARRWGYLAPDGPGPGFFPTWYGIAMIALSLAVIAGAVGKRAIEPGQRVHWGGVGRALLAWGALAASIALIKVLGFLVAFALLMFTVVSLMYGRSFVQGIVAGVLGALGFYLVFPLALNVELPTGVLGF